MKIMVVGESHPWSYETFYVRLFKTMGCEVLHWDNHKPSLMFGNRSWWNLSRPEKLAYDSMATLCFYRTAMTFCPEMIFMPRGENIHSHAVRRVLESISAKLVIWYPDHPFHPDQTSMNVLRNMKRCHVFYIWGRFLLESLRSGGCRRAEYLPFSFNPDYHPPDIPLTTEDQKRFGCEVVFVGTWQPEREEILRSLTSFDLGIWGPFWGERLPQDSPLRQNLRGGALHGKDMVKAFKGAQVVLNLLQPHNGSAHNSRTMEATGIGGGALLVRRTPEQARELFTENEHLFCYDSVKDLPAVLSDLLSKKSALRETADRARKHVEKHHLLRDRIRYILDHL